MPESTITHANTCSGSRKKSTLNSSIVSYTKNYHYNFKETMHQQVPVLNMKSSRQHKLCISKVHANTDISSILFKLYFSTTHYHRILEEATGFVIGGHTFSNYY